MGDGGEGKAARRGEVPVSGCEAWADVPASVISIPREAQATGPGMSETWPSGRPGRLCSAKA
jgi:hypothetical protein